MVNENADGRSSDMKKLHGALDYEKKGKRIKRKTPLYVDFARKERKE